MASSQHSLPYSASVPSVNFTPRPSQLPSSLSSVGASTRLDGAADGRLRSGSTSTHARNGSIVSATPRPRPPLPISGEPQSPSRKSFGAGSTHAGGILPSASFFRPARPTNIPLSFLDDSRRSSVASSHGLPSPREYLGPSQLVPHPQDVSYDSDASASGSMGPTSDVNHAPLVPAQRAPVGEDPARHLPVKNTKYSREPLLPVSSPVRARAGSSATHQSRPSLSRSALERSASKTSTGPASAGARVRDSFERFRKGLSLEMVRRLSHNGSQNNSPVTAEARFVDNMSTVGTSNGRTTFETKQFDEDEVFKIERPLPSPPRAVPDSYVPFPPQDGPLLSAVPRRDGKNVRYVRNYELHPSSNRWFWKGRLLTGGDTPWAFIGTFALVLGISGVWFGTTCVWWWHNESPAVAIVGAYLCLLTISLQLSTVRLNSVSCDVSATLLMMRRCHDRHSQILVSFRET
ncbi:hypothetical protein FA95DRAFT_1551803 [Auriscalpium vulgare]|uniref:Uncharacterized protein n=1 Tax=Auriscalpium vulgare TaxID=40419 RepID=A0ACB8SDH3_9AGAM|nr:hypothetical protein FA95DRAFT_1551803 [Auriscalpium vulgare]